MEKNTRICIVGGGPAGLSAGMYLEQKGYENYTILERLDRVGGKYWSPHYNGRRYEMGAIMGVPSYYAVHDVEEFCGITHDGPKLNRNYKNAKGDIIEPFEPKKNILKIPRLLKMKKQIKKLGEILETKYKGYDVNGHRGVAEGRYDGYSQQNAKREHISGDNPHLKDLCLPFAEFCKLNGVELTQDVWIGPYTSFGYGYFDEIPAGYETAHRDRVPEEIVSDGKYTNRKPRKCLRDLPGQLPDHRLDQLAADRRDMSPSLRKLCQIILLRKTQGFIERAFMVEKALES